VNRIAALMFTGLVLVTIAGCPSREKKPQPGELVGQLPEAPPPGSEALESPSGGNAIQPSAPAGPSTGAATDAGPLASPGKDPVKPLHKPMSEEKFIAISAKLVLASKTVPDTAVGRDQLEGYTMQVLRENEVTTEEFQAYTNQIQHDEPRRKRIADRILERARSYAPMKVKAKLKPVPPEKATSAEQ